MYSRKKQSHPVRWRLRHACPYQNLQSWTMGILNWLRRPELAQARPSYPHLQVQSLVFVV